MMLMNQDQALCSIVIRCKGEQSTLRTSSLRRVNVYICSVWYIFSIVRSAQFVRSNAVYGSSYKLALDIHDIAGVSIKLSQETEGTVCSSQLRGKRAGWAGR
jgi:hypothetical protein